MSVRTLALLVGISTAVALGVSADPALAGKPRAATPAKAKPGADKAHAAAGATPDKTDTPPTPESAPEKTVPTSAKPEKAGGAPVVKTEEGKEGVKTYKFGAVEVEGRLRSPQLIYFLRRVRAEFLAGDLGHRSFLPELSETQRSATFR
ncbi:MAG TPA: hypothetical protein VHE30_15150 [Polyangiaceae bacterium]|nr:hypothetical protein [Polyangiaceae bacterium]